MAYDEPSDERSEAFQAVQMQLESLLGRPPRFENVRIRGTIVEVINVPTDERSAWIAVITNVLGSEYVTQFIQEDISYEGASILGKMGVGELEIEKLNCGCEAVQILGEDDWQLVRVGTCDLQVHNPRYLRTRTM